MGRAFSLIVGVLTVVFMASPLLLVVVFSFNSSVVMTFPLESFTLEWYRKLLSRPDFIGAARNSVIVTLSVGAAATLIGTLSAFAIARMRPGRSGLATLFFCLPIMMPPLMLALSLLALFSAVGMRLSLYTVILAHLTFTMPFVIIIVAARLRNFDWTMVDSARDLGAGSFATFRTVVLPQTAPTLIGAALIAMALSLDDFIITFFVLGGGNTLPTLVWGMLRTGLDPSINALGSLILLGSLGTAALALRLTGYRG